MPANQPTVSKTGMQIQMEPSRPPHARKPETEVIERTRRLGTTHELLVTTNNS
jgi:hypothetical protein